MGNQPQDKPDEQPYRRPVGFLEAIVASRRIEKYSDLVKLDNLTWTHDQSERERLTSKFEKYMDDKKVQPKYDLVSKEIRKLTAAVYHDLLRINAPTWWSEEKNELEYDFNKHRQVQKKKRVEYNVILDRQYPVFRGKKGHVDNDVTYAMLDESKAVYDHVYKFYWTKWINPLWWLAFVLRLPISLLEHMGVDTKTTNVNRLVYWMLQGLVGILIALIALKLGVTPWK